MFDLDLPTLISRIIILIIAFTVHEFSHAKVADLFGDMTPRANGRLTLNPLRHLDPMGSLLLLFAGFGWARPVPVNPYALSRRAPSALMWVSLAGPASNFFLAILGAIPLRAGILPTSFGGAAFLPTPVDFMFEFVWVNLALMLFNLIPLAPLDGSKIAEYFAPPSLARVLETIAPYGPVILLAVVFIGPRLGLNIFDLIMTQPLINLYLLLTGGF
ncbi:MAG TPA: site-2 protease family protein [Anaerolineaceae bacterium]